jgi:hypothetical protein
VEFQGRSHGSRKRKVTVFAIVALAATVGLGVTVASAHGRGHRPWQPKPSPTAAPAPTATPAPSPAPDPSDPPSDDPSPSPSASPEPSPAPAPPAAGDPDGTGPLLASDYADIRTAGATPGAPRGRRTGSFGTFTARCGKNENLHRNSDNFIVAPGVSNGAHHQHDNVGNLSADGNSTNESLAAAGTTCAQGDKSTYFWTVIRDITQQGDDVDKPGGGLDGNLGRILAPTTVSIQFRGNPVSKVVAFPQFTRIITGDAKAAVTNFPSANQRARWSCSGTPGKTFTDKYPLCQRGQLVIRTHDFPSCWDGVNTDSANHRTHVVFPDAATGACPAGTKAIPQLRITLGYRVKPGRTFAVDTFPQELRKPITDHDDFVNVMPDSLMAKAVTAINQGRRI